MILLFLATLHQIVLQRLWIWLPAAFHLFWVSVGIYALSYAARSALFVCSWRAALLASQASAAEEVALVFVPYDWHGEIHEVPWDQLVDGEYTTESFTKSSVIAVDPEHGALRYGEKPDGLLEFMVHLSEAMKHYE